MNLRNTQYLDLLVKIYGICLTRAGSGVARQPPGSRLSHLLPILLIFIKP
ncbi:hypothetical protein SOVF_214330 [Spinacia oleracea]|nr:hypothetical protein SOVF_214330 [Spinacia oleracea]